MHIRRRKVRHGRLLESATMKVGRKHFYPELERPGNGISAAE
jgi:hypothetical protein